MPARFAVDPARTALIVVDLQHCFLDHAVGGPEVVERVNRIATACRDAGALVVHTQHVLEPDGSDAGLLGEFVGTDHLGRFARGSASVELHPDVDRRPGDLLVEKQRFGAFHGTDLERTLRDRGIDTVIVTGAFTEVCCETTTREANARDFKVLFVSDANATGGPDAAAVQASSLARLGTLFAEVLATDELLVRLHGAAPA